MSVPADLRGIVGRDRLVKGLGTRSLAVAQILKEEPIAEFKRQIADAALAVGRLHPGRPSAREAAAIDRARARIMATDPARLAAFEAALAEDMANSVNESARTMPARDDRQDFAARLRSIVIGEVTPVAKHHAAFKAGLSANPRSLQDDDRVMQCLVDWCRKTGIPPTIESFDAKTAHRMARETLDELSQATIAKYHGRLVMYWDYLLCLGAAPANPFRSFKITSASEAGQADLRSFTDMEVARLLEGCTEPGLRDLMPIAALTGARIEAICNLTVGDCREGYLTFTSQRNGTARRDVPIHSDLVDIIRRRTMGRSDNAWLFPEYPIPAPPSTKSRSQYASKRFIKYRREIGIGECPPDGTRSEVNFESFRRWFIEKALDGGHHREVLAAVLGSTPQTIPLVRNCRNGRMDAARSLVDSIALPTIPFDPTP